MQILELLNTKHLILMGTAFLTASISGAIGMVGGIILLSVMAQYYRMEILIPLHGCIQLVSNFSRMFFLIPNVNWKVGGLFIVGALLGGTLGSQFILEIPEDIFKIGIGLFILFIMFKPKPKKKIKIPGKWFFLGFIASFLSLFVGAIGVLVGSFFVNEDFSKKEFVSTQSLCQFFTHVIKVIVYFIAGFAIGPYLSTFFLMILMTIAGTYLGTRLLEKIPERIFHMVVKIVIVILCSKLILDGLSPFLT